MPFSGKVPAVQASGVIVQQLGVPTATLCVGGDHLSAPRDEGRRQNKPHFTGQRSQLEDERIVVGREDSYGRRLPEETKGSRQKSLPSVFQSSYHFDFNRFLSLRLASHGHRSE